MPWTFSHPAAALPLLRFCGSQIERCALIIGCVSPDIGYYLGGWGQHLHAHSVVGSFTVCLPLGWGLLLIFIGLRAPVIFMMPWRVRVRFENVAHAPIALNGQALLRCSVWLILGAWTHIFWDGWTHYNGVFVQQFVVLQVQLWLASPGYRWLQHLSTALGILLLFWWFVRSQRNMKPFEEGADQFEQFRIDITLRCMLVALTWALQHAGTLAETVPKELYWRAFVFNFAITSVVIFTVLWLFAALAFSHWMSGRSNAKDCDTR